MPQLRNYQEDQSSISDDLPQWKNNDLLGVFRSFEALSAEFFLGLKNLNLLAR